MAACIRRGRNCTETACMVCMGVGILLLNCLGCASFTKSRYAMDDPVYAEKYAEGAERWDFLGKIKQACDARHTEGLEGGYWSGGTQWRGDSILGGLEVGSEVYATNWYTGRMALGGYLGHGDWFAGVDTGIRLQLPSRLAPFVGLGSFNGLSTAWEDATDDGEDNDDDGFVDENGEEDIEFDGWLSTVYPEVGAHFWPTGQSRFSVYGRYLITTEGREHDDWMVGLQFTTFSR